MNEETYLESYDVGPEKRRWNSIAKIIARENPGLLDYMTDKLMESVSDEKLGSTLERGTVYRIRTGDDDTLMEIAYGEAIGRDEGTLYVRPGENGEYVKSRGSEGFVGRKTSENREGEKVHGTRLFQISQQWSEKSKKLEETQEVYEEHTSEEPTATSTSRLHIAYRIYEDGSLEITPLRSDDGDSEINDSVKFEEIDKDLLEEDQS